MAQEALLLGESDGLTIRHIKLHATAVFGILNHYIRRDERQPRVIGSLLGARTGDGGVEVTNSFGIPYAERTNADTETFMMDGPYNRDMVAYHRRVNRKDSLVGWYSTSVLSGPLVLSENSAVQYQFYKAQGCANAVHLVVDTTLTGDSISVRGFVPTTLAVGGEDGGVIANMFREVRVELCLSVSEQAAVYHMIHSQAPAGGVARWASSEVLSVIPSESSLLQLSMARLSEVLGTLAAYVDEVAAGRRAGDATVGMALAGVLSSIRVFRPEEFKAIADGKVQDLLMVSYLSTLVKSQLTIAEKLLTIL